MSLSKKDDLQAFIVKAKANTYVGQGRRSLAFRIALVFGSPLEEVFTYDPKDDPI